MNSQLFVRGFLVTGLVGLIWPMAAIAPPDGQDPWTKAPPMPTACYSESDSAQEKLSAAIEAVKADMDRQEKINDELSDRLKAVDHMELSSRMQQYMMDHPEEGMKLMQQNAALGETYTATQMQSEENRKKLEAELADLLVRY